MHLCFDSFRWRKHLRNMWLRSLMSLTTVTSMMTCLFPRWLQALMSLSMRWDSAARTATWAWLCVFSSSVSFFPLYSSLCVFVGQIIEYEDYDNTTDYYHVNEYEYEEEDERYGPAERDREFSLNTQVASKRSVIRKGIVQRMSLIHSYINN